MRSYVSNFATQKVLTRICLPDISIVELSFASDRAIFVFPDSFVVQALVPQRLPAYLVLTHEAIDRCAVGIFDRPLILQEIPCNDSEGLREAHGDAYGRLHHPGRGLLPFGSHFFSDLTHDRAQLGLRGKTGGRTSDTDEYAFALGAADYARTQWAFDRDECAVPRSIQNCDASTGNEGDLLGQPGAHIKTEFGST